MKLIIFGVLLCLLSAPVSAQVYDVILHHCDESWREVSPQFRITLNEEDGTFSNSRGDSGFWGMDNGLMWLLYDKEEMVMMVGNLRRGISASSLRPQDDRLFCYRMQKVRD